MVWYGVRSVPDSEFITAISEPSFWEGRVTVKGSCMGEAVTGFGFVEVHGYQVLFVIVPVPVLSRSFSFFP